MKLSKKYPAIMGGVALIVLVVGVTTDAAEKTAPRRAGEKKRPAQAGIPRGGRSREMLETIRTVRTIEALELSEEQIARFLPKQRRMKEMRENHFKVRREKVEKLAKLLESKASARVLEKTLAELKGDAEKFQAESKALRDELDSMLTPEQQARLIIFRKNFHKQMQEMLRRPPRQPRQPGKGRELPGPLEEELPPEEGPSMEKMR